MKTILAIIICLLYLPMPAFAQPPVYSNADVLRLESSVNMADGEKDKLPLLLKLGHAYVERDTNTVAVDKGFNNMRYAVQLSKKLDNTRALAEAYFLLGHFIGAKGNTTAAKRYIDASITLAERQGNYLLTGNAYVLKWQTICAESAGYDARVALLEKAAEAFHHCGDKKQEGNCCKELGDLHLINGKFMPALISLRRSLELFTQIKYPHTQGVHDLLGKTYLRLGDYKSAVAYGLKAIAISQQLGDTGSVSLATCYNRLGSTYAQIGDYTHSEAVFRKALAIDIRHSDTFNLFYIAYNIVTQLLHQNKTSEAYSFFYNLKAKYPTLGASDTIGLALLYTQIYAKPEHFHKGLPYSRYLEAVATASDIRDNMLPLLYNVIIPFYISGNDWKKAQLLSARYQKYNEATNTREGWSRYYKLQFQIDSARGDYRQAIDHYQKSVVFQDSLFNETKSHQVSELNVLYETEKKDKDLLLLKRGAELQANRIRMSDLQRNITLLVLLLSGMVLFTLLRGYRKKKKSNRLLERKQEEIERKNNALEQLVREKEWLVKEIHHRVKNNLHMVVGLLATQTGFLKDEEAMQAMTESRNRVEAMAIIHQRLYRTDDLSAIDMAPYIADLADHLQYSGIGGVARVISDIDPVALPLSHSVPIGLIVNEAVTNAMKYAFDNKERGVITIRLKADSASAYTLSISDEGKGLPESFDPDHSASFGVTLMKGLAQEIHGSFHMRSTQGTCVTVSFEVPPVSAPPLPGRKPDQLVHG